MPRALWSGSLSFGLVNVPVQLVSAARDLDLHFRQLHDKDHTPIETRRVCSRENREIPYEEVAHGYDFHGKQVVLTDEDLAAAAPRKTRTIDIEEFVPFADIEPIYFDHPYFLIPAGDMEGTTRAYRLLIEVMADTERAALGRFVLRTKEYLVAVRVRDDALALSTLLFADEVRPTDDIDVADAKQQRPSKQHVDQAVRLIEALSRPWDPARYEDRYRQRLLEIVEKKRRGLTVKAPSVEKEPAPTPDLMAALEQALVEAGAPASPAGKAALD
jgi:DNA end-binding protein Ku